MHIFNDEYARRKSNYIGDPKIAKEIDHEDASTNEASNQKIQRTTWQKENAKWKIDIMIRSRGECSKWYEETLQGLCTSYNLHLNTICTNMASLFPRYHLNQSKYQETKERWAQSGAENKIRKLPKVRAQLRFLHLSTMCTTWNPHSLYLFKNTTMYKREIFFFIT